MEEPILSSTHLNESAISDDNQYDMSDEYNSKNDITLNDSIEAVIASSTHLNKSDHADCNQVPAMYTTMVDRLQQVFIRINTNQTMEKSARKLAQDYIKSEVSRKDNLSIVKNAVADSPNVLQEIDKILDLVKQKGISIWSNILHKGGSLDQKENQLDKEIVAGLKRLKELDIDVVNQALWEIICKAMFSEPIFSSDRLTRV